MCPYLLSRIRFFCDPVDCNMPEFSLSLRFPGESTEVVAICFKGMTLTQGVNPRLLLQQVDSLPLRHLGSVQ